MKTFKHFGHTFDVINPDDSRYYHVNHVPSGKRVSCEKTMKMAILVAKKRLDEEGEEGFSAALAAITLSEFEAKADAREARRQRRIDRVLRKRDNLSSKYWGHIQALNRIKQHTITLRNGKILYPSIKDVERCVDRQNQKAINSLNPAFRYINAYSRECEAFQAAYQGSALVA